jgi:hypothetical protein
MSLASQAAGLAWYSANLPGERAFRKALRDPQACQERLLRQYLHQNADTAFGKQHGFISIRSVTEYQERIPLSDYNGHAPWFDRAAAGETGVLTRDPVRHFALSSGSTRAAKQIPYTSTLQEEFRRAVAPWMVDLFRTRPDLALGPAYWSISPVAREATRTSGGIPVGFEEDSAYLGGLWKRLVDGMMAVPSSVRHIRDLETFRHATAIHLLRCRELRILSVWHPSFLDLLLESMEENWDGLLHDIGGGRAAELSRLGPRDYAGIWPRLGLVSCWGDGHAAMHLEALRRRFPGVTVQPKGLIATEAFVTLPYAGRMPVAVRSHFFEFLDEAGVPRLVHQLEQGREYSVVVTTGGGLYRYRLEDRVAVTGFLDATPSLRFLGKEDHVSDLRGEKLSEGFVSSAQRGVFQRHGLSPSFAMLAPTEAGDRYALFIESDRDLPDRLATDLDEALQENPHYRYCRDLGQLAPAEVVQVSQDGYRHYVERCRSRGQRTGDIKACALSNASGWAEVFR